MHINKLYVDMVQQHRNATSENRSDMQYTNMLGVTTHFTLHNFRNRFRIQHTAKCLSDTSVYTYTVVRQDVGLLHLGSLFSLIHITESD